MSAITRLLKVQSVFMLAFAIGTGVAKGDLSISYYAYSDLAASPFVPGDLAYSTGVGTLSFPQFDPRMGTLTGVKFDFGSDVLGSPYVTVQNDFDDLLHVIVSGTTRVSLVMPSVCAVAREEAWEYDAYLNPGDMLRDSSVLPAGYYGNPWVVGDLSAYIGVGSVSASVQADIVMYIYGIGTFPSVVDYRSPTTFETFVALEYHFIPTPEPTSLAIATLSGAIVLGYASCRRWRR